MALNLRLRFRVSGLGFTDGPSSLRSTALAALLLVGVFQNWELDVGPPEMRKVPPKVALPRVPRNSS